MTLDIARKSFERNIAPFARNKKRFNAITIALKLSSAIQAIEHNIRLRRTPPENLRFNEECDQHAQARSEIYFPLRSTHGTRIQYALIRSRKLILNKFSSGAGREGEPRPSSEICVVQQVCVPEDA